LQSFTAMLRSGMGLPDMLEGLFGDLGLSLFPETQMVRFHCGCSQDRVFNALTMLGEDELQDMINKAEDAEATCHFCNTVYRASPKQIQAILAQMRMQSEA
jgi:molecular chaperone Hsp33